MSLFEPIHQLCRPESYYSSSLKILIIRSKYSKNVNLILKTDRLTQAFVGEGALGLIAVSGVTGLKEGRARLLPLASELANLPETTLRLYENPESKFAVGWSRGEEALEGEGADSLKGSFYANPLFDRPGEGVDADVAAACPSTVQCFLFSRNIS